MFSERETLTNIVFENINMSKLTDMSWMFDGCSALTSLDLSNFNTSKVTTMSNMFNECLVLETIYVGLNWSAGDHVSESIRMFYNCKKLKGDVSYKSAYIDKTYATYTGGYLTLKN